MEEYIDIPAEPDPWWKGPLKYILGLFLILLLILWYVPTQLVRIDPSPRYIPSLQEVIPKGIVADGGKSPSSKEEFKSFLTPNDPVVKQTADKVVQGCEGGKVCHAKAIYYFVRDNFQYVSDPSAFEYVKSAKESLAAQGGDCDDAAVLAANLLQAVGIRTRFVFIPGHVYIQAYLPDAAKRYKAEDADYVSLDLTCKDCSFGELPYSDFTQNKQIIQ